jgi:hypothetical protein
MKTTKRVSLNADVSIGYGYLLHCCNKHQPVHINEMDIGDRWECVECEKPLLLRTQLGFYVVGANIDI